MATLGELARLIRSKNAGPFVLTFDIMFDDEATYRKVIASRVLTRPIFTSLYQLTEEDVLLFEHNAARAIKISIPRPMCNATWRTATPMGAGSTRLLSISRCPVDSPTGDGRRAPRSRR